MARKKGDERKMPCLTVEKTSSHSPSIAANSVGSGGEAIMSCRSSPSMISILSLYASEEVGL